MHVYVCVCVCVCVRAAWRVCMCVVCVCVRACARVCVVQRVRRGGQVRQSCVICIVAVRLKPRSLIQQSSPLPSQAYAQP